MKWLRENANLIQLIIIVVTLCVFVSGVEWPQVLIKSVKRYGWIVNHDE